MRKIENAVLKQTIQKMLPGQGLYSSDTKTGICIADRYFEEQGRNTLIDILSKYITFQDINAHYWIDRYWYFDVEQYEKDLQTFGIPFAKPILEKIRMERPE